MYCGFIYKIILQNHMEGIGWEKLSTAGILEVNIGWRFGGFEVTIVLDGGVC
jgi:hypothetical protein